MAAPGYNTADWAAQGIVLEGTKTETQLFTAEDDIKTVGAVFATDQVLAELTIVAMNATNELVPWDPAGVTSGAVPYGVTSYNINTTDIVGEMDEVYVGACFNPALLVWPAGLDTYQEQLAALAGATFRIKRLL